MAELSNFHVAQFGQKDETDATFKYKIRAQSGVCVGLCVSWLNMINKGVLMNDMDALKKEFDISINIHSIYSDAFKENKASGFRAQMNAISNVTKMTLESKGEGQFFDPFSTKIRELENGPYFLSVDFVKGAHAFAFLVIEENFVLFDPNSGLFYANRPETTSLFSSALFAWYKSQGHEIGYWEILRVRGALSSLERYKLAAGLQPGQP